MNDRSKVHLRQNDQDLIINWMWGCGTARSQELYPGLRHGVSHWNKNTGEKIHLRESRNIEYEESMGILMELSSI